MNSLQPAFDSLISHSMISRRFPEIYTLFHFTRVYEAESVHYYWLSQPFTMTWNNSHHGRVRPFAGHQSSSLLALECHSLRLTPSSFSRFPIISEKSLTLYVSHTRECAFSQFQVLIHSFIWHLVDDAHKHHLCVLIFLALSDNRFKPSCLGDAGKAKWDPKRVVRANEWWTRPRERNILRAVAINSPALLQFPDMCACECSAALISFDNFSSS